MIIVSLGAARRPNDSAGPPRTLRFHVHERPGSALSVESSCRLASSHPQTKNAPAPSPPHLLRAAMARHKQAATPRRPPRPLLDAVCCTPRCSLPQPSPSPDALPITQLISSATHLLDATQSSLMQLAINSVPAYSRTHRTTASSSSRPAQRRQQTVALRSSRKTNMCTKKFKKSQLKQKHKPVPAKQIAGSSKIGRRW